MTETATKMPLQEWANNHEPSENLIFKDGYWEQIRFVRDTIPYVLTKTYKKGRIIQENIRVISSHVSKSVELPVYQIRLNDGTSFTLRYNFHDWKVSVDSPTPVETDFMGLFNPDEQIGDVYCEGFPVETVFSSYNRNKNRFTVEIPDEYHLFTFFWIYADKILGNQNK